MFTQKKSFVGFISKCRRDTRVSAPLNYLHAFIFVYNAKFLVSDFLRNFQDVTMPFLHISRVLLTLGGGM